MNNRIKQIINSFEIGKYSSKPIYKYADYIDRVTGGNNISAGMTSLFVAWLGIAALVFGIGVTIVKQDIWIINRMSLRRL